MRHEGFHVWHEEWVKPHFKFSLSRKEREWNWYEGYESQVKLIWDQHHVAFVWSPLANHQK